MRDFVSNEDQITNPSVIADLGGIGDAIPGDTSTTETITVGGTREESVDAAGDTDWFQLDLQQGQAVQIDILANDLAGNGLGELGKREVTIYDADGNEIYGDDNKGFFDSKAQIIFVAPEDGTYFVSAGSYNDSQTGDYQLVVTEITPVPTPVDAIRGDTMLNTDDVVLVYFSVAGDQYNFAGDQYIATGTNAYEQAQMFSVFDGMSDFADIQFAVTTDRAAADLEVGTAVLSSTGGGTLLGFFNFPSNTGEGSFGIFNNDSDNFPLWNDAPGGTIDTGGFMYGTLLHEFGHGVGMGHTHDTGNGTTKMLGVSNSADYGYYGINSAAYTVMSYNDGSQIAGAASSVADNGHAATYGALDIAALQDMYGANTTFASGDDVYTLFDANGTGTAAGYYSTWDTGGTDEFLYVGSKDAVIDLRAATLEYQDGLGAGGYMSYVDGVIAGRTIANGVVIENATSDAGDDMLIGNSVANVLEAGAGDDRLIGNGGDDTLRGGDGNDRIGGGGGHDSLWGGNDDDKLFGKGGNDEMGGGNGNDTLWGGNGNDTIFGTAGDNKLGGGDGDDLIWAGDSAVIYASAGNDEVHGGSGNDTLFGGAGDDYIVGGGGSDSIAGGSGNDTIDGQGNNDTLTGGGGNDVFVFAVGKDVITDFDATNDQEKIDLSGVAGITDFVDLNTDHLTQVGNDAVIGNLGGLTLTLLNVDINDLDAADFIF